MDHKLNISKIKGVLWEKTIRKNKKIREFNKRIQDNLRQREAIVRLKNSSKA